MPYAKDNGVELWYDVNGTGQPLGDARPDCLAVGSTATRR